MNTVWFIRERTPLGVQGLVRKNSVVECRRPLGLRANGCGSLIMRRCLLLLVNMSRACVRQGLKRKWTAVCEFLNPPWPPKGGDHPSAVAGSGRTLRKARRRGGVRRNCVHDCRGE